MMRRTLAIATLCLALVTPWASPSRAEAPVADLAASSGGLEWRATLPNDGLTLTVAFPDGRVERRELASGEPAVFGLFDSKGARIPDGQYRWQIDLTPKVPQDARRQIAAARDAGDESTAARILAGLRLPAETRQSGFFQVEGGVLYAGGGLEPEASGAPAALAAPGGNNVKTTFTDSLCVGFDCTNSESFGSDTIRMKENNLNIHFDDTSTAAGFANRDWRLEANDEGSGGANKFSISDATGATVPFTIEGGTPNNALFVDNSSRVGLGTSTPVLNLHVSTGNTPAIRLEQSAVSGFTAQTWDMAGNEANFFVRDVTSGSRLPFRIRPGAPSSSLDIASDGDIGIGTASPEQRLDVRSGGVTNIQATTFGAGQDDRADFIIRRARGTSAVPTAVQLNDRIGGFQARGHNGTAFSDIAASFDVRAEENFSATANGTRLAFQTTANGAIVPTTRMVIRQNGRVGVGTTSPTELLHVSGGNLLVSGGGFFDDGVPVTDFVFEPDYRLMPLDELKTFVATHKHLPNVPSKDDAKSAGGVNIGLYSMRILEKVEELTLYTLDQHEQIQSLEAQKAELARKNAELEARLARIEALLAGMQAD
jgi:hypothetical protein